METQQLHVTDEKWSWRRTKFHGVEVAEWFARSGWSTHDAPTLQQHAFVDEFHTPTIAVRRIWHTPIRLTRDSRRIGMGSHPSVSVLMQLAGESVVSPHPGSEVPIPTGSVLFHSRPLAMMMSERATARFEVILRRRGDLAELTKVVRRDESSTWLALAGVINSVLNARESPDRRMLALYAQSIETLADAMWFESHPVTSPSENDTFSCALELIYRHSADPSFTIEVLAQMLGVTRAHVTRLFRQRGAMPSRVLKRERVYNARRMLAADPDTPLETVVISCGFSSVRQLRESLRGPLTQGVTVKSSSAVQM